MVQRSMDPAGNELESIKGVSLHCPAQLVITLIVAPHLTLLLLTPTVVGAIKSNFMTFLALRVFL